MALYLALNRQKSELGIIHEIGGRGALFAFFIFLSLCLYFVVFGN